MEGPAVRRVAIVPAVATVSAVPSQEPIKVDGLLTKCTELACVADAERGEGE